MGLDHNTFTDGCYPDSALPSYYGRLYQQHDGELDIVRGADQVTVPWNVFADHDKTLTIGNSDSAAGTDRGRLRVTLHHNLFSGLVERAPRVRLGKVDVYNNHYVIDARRASYSYSLGIGKESRLVAEKDAFTLAGGVSAGRLLKKWSEAPLTAECNVVNGRPVDLIAAHNAEFPGHRLESPAGWEPRLRTRVDTPNAVSRLVGRRAGAESSTDCSTGSRTHRAGTSPGATGGARDERFGVAHGRPVTVRGRPRCPAYSAPPPGSSPECSRPGRRVSCSRDRPP